MQSGPFWPVIELNGICKYLETKILKLHRFYEVSRLGWKYFKIKKNIKEDVHKLLMTIKGPTECNGEHYKSKYNITVT